MFETVSQIIAGEAEAALQATMANDRRRKNEPVAEGLLINREQNDVTAFENLIRKKDETIRDYAECTRNLMDVILRKNQEIAGLRRELARYAAGTASDRPRSEGEPETAPHWTAKQPQLAA